MSYANGTTAGYVDGQLQGTVSGTKEYPPTLFYGLGSPCNTSRGNSSAFNGQMDEARVSNIARSANWIWAEFMNMASNGVFNTYGAASPINADLPQISDVGAQNLSNTSADVVGTLVTNGAAGPATVSPPIRPASRIRPINGPMLRWLWTALAWC
jgi:hypothetical protein